MIENMERMLRLPEILEITGVSAATIWRWVNSGDFPAPVRLGSLRTRSIGWRSSEVQHWLDTRPRFDATLYETMK